MLGSPNVPWLNTVRPNSVTKSTSVSSSRPRCLRSLQQRRRRLIDVAALIGQLPFEGDVLIPAAMEELHEAHAALDQSTAEQTIRRVAARLVHVGAVRLERGGRSRRSDR